LIGIPSCKNNEISLREMLLFCRRKLSGIGRADLESVDRDHLVKFGIEKHLSMETWSIIRIKLFVRQVISSIYFY